MVAYEIVYRVVLCYVELNSVAAVVLYTGIGQAYP